MLCVGFFKIIAPRPVMTYLEHYAKVMSWIIFPFHLGRMILKVTTSYKPQTLKTFPNHFVFFETLVMLMKSINAAFVYKVTYAVVMFLLDICDQCIVCLIVFNAVPECDQCMRQDSIINNETFNSFSSAVLCLRLRLQSLEQDRFLQSSL